VGKVRKFFSDILTEPDNHTFCPVRILAALGSLQYIALAAANYVQHNVFDPQGYAVGFGALIGGVGVALKLKKDSKEDGNDTSGSSSAKP
jgi:hypothetical protein